MRTQAVTRIRSLFQQEMTAYQPGPHLGPQAHSDLDAQFRDQPRLRLYLCSQLRQLNLFNAEVELSLGSWSRSSKEAALLMSIPGTTFVLMRDLFRGSINLARLIELAGLVVWEEEP